MNFKAKLISLGLVLLVISLILVGETPTSFKRIGAYYQVYLNGNKLGVIADKTELYDLINEKQKNVRQKYQVDYVYPPNNLVVAKYYTYNQSVMDVDDVYAKIQQEGNFMVKGYVIKIIKGNQEIIINVLDKKVFEDAIDNFITAFVDENQYHDFLKGTQSEIKDVGKLIETMYFDETITIKEALINIQAKIFLNADELKQYLLFGPQAELKDYTIKEGDTIASVAEDNKLNSQEFLIANPRFKSENDLLALGDIVNITLINPIITLTYELYSIEDVQQYFEKNVVYDAKKPSDYSEITQPGMNGITRITSRYAVINGQQSQGIIKLGEEVLRKKVDQITTKGNRRVYYGTYVDLDGNWGWPTNGGYVITSPFGYRSFVDNHGNRHSGFHQGIDIAVGYGSGSPIYSVGDGIVTDVGYQGKGGKVITINHGNDIYTFYAHLSDQLVKVGQTVKRGEVIGKMGQTGFTTGPHLHFGVSIKAPWTNGSKFINPLSLYK